MTSYGINGNFGYNLFFPVGCIVAYIGTDVPDGWLICDGSTIGSDTKYNALKSFLGGATNVPNLNAAFLRGAGRYDSNRVGPSLANYQGDAIKQHNHNLNFDSVSRGGTATSNMAAVFFSTNVSSETIKTFVNNVDVGSTETKPLSYSVKWMIKY